jgi:hypothetical protein
MAHFSMAERKDALKVLASNCSYGAELYWLMTFIPVHEFLAAHALSMTTLVTCDHISDSPAKNNKT